MPKAVEKKDTARLEISPRGSGPLMKRRRINTERREEGTLENAEVNTPSVRFGKVSKIIGSFGKGEGDLPECCPGTA